jgi:hypothetical protein
MFGPSKIWQPWSEQNPISSGSFHCQLKSLHNHKTKTLGDVATAILRSLERMTYVLQKCQIGDMTFWQH